MLFILYEFCCDSLSVTDRSGESDVWFDSCIGFYTQMLICGVMQCYCEFFYLPDISNMIGQLVKRCVD